MKKLPRKPKTKYVYELAYPDYGKVIAFPPSKLGNDERLIRLKFKTIPRKIRPRCYDTLYCSRWPGCRIVRMRCGKRYKEDFDGHKSLGRLRYLRWQISSKKNCCMK